MPPQSQGPMTPGQRDLVQTRVMLAIAAGNKRAKTDWDKVNPQRLKNVAFRGMTMREAMGRGFSTSGLTAAEVQRLVRNAQSAIAKDIKAVDRDLKTLNDANDPQHTRRNATVALKQRLENLRDEMKQKVKVDGQLQVHTPGSRLNAVEDYYRNYKGKGPRKVAMAGHYVKRDMTDDARKYDANFRQKWKFRLYRESFDGYGDYTTRASELFDEYEEALLLGDYQGVQEAVLAIIDHYGRARNMFND